MPGCLGDDPDRRQTVSMSPRAQIICVDCGGTCHLLSRSRPEAPWKPGDTAAYRCADCMDRWDIVLEADDIDED